MRRTVVRDPSGLLAYRAYTYRGYVIITWPRLRSVRPRIQEGIESHDVPRYVASNCLRAMRTLTNNHPSRS